MKIVITATTMDKAKEAAGAVSDAMADAGFWFRKMTASKPSEGEPRTIEIEFDD